MRHLLQGSFPSLYDLERTIAEVLCREDIGLFIGEIMAGDYRFTICKAMDQRRLAAFWLCSGLVNASGTRTLNLTFLDTLYNDGQKTIPHGK